MEEFKAWKIFERWGEFKYCTEDISQGNEYSALQCAQMDCLCCQCERYGRAVQVRG